MKKSLLILFSLLYLIAIVHAQNIWMNEIHYDNTGTDQGEFIEIVLENAGNYNLADFAVDLYNASNGEVYNTKTLDEYTSGVISGDFKLLYFNYPVNGIQNGPEDGVTISYQGTLIEGQFLSYEGTLTAVDGPAAGKTSSDIGVSEIGADPSTSLQLGGTGTKYDEFAWQESAPETKGDLNNNQTFGGFTPDPEPSNYPTNFYAETAGLTIELTWTDAVGQQLPPAYLILGELLPVSGRDVPVDGTPVPDDLDWSDGKAAVNVAYGQEMYTFNELTGNEHYGFVIYPYTNSGSYIDYKTDGTPPEASVQTLMITIINEEMFTDSIDGFGSWSTYNVTGDQLWEWAPYGNPPGCAKMEGYEDGNYYENEDWLISPHLNLLDFESVQFSFDHARNFGSNDQLFVLISNDYDGVSDPSTNGDWEDITDEFTFPETGSWNFLFAGESNITEYAGEETFIAFKYTSTDESTATWEVDNIMVYGTSGVGLFENNATELIIYPNPASALISLIADCKGRLVITNLTGQIVHQELLDKGTAVVSVVELNEGLYLVQFIGNNRKVVTGKLMVK